MRIFLDDTDYRRFTFLLGDVVQEYDIECWDYCAMPNHYHATLRPRLANLSDAMKRLNSLYAQWWNKRHSHVGHVFQGRFKDQIVQDDRYLHALCRYIALNPVRAGLVAHPADWEWSSCAAMLGMRAMPPFLSDHLILRMSGDNDLSIVREKLAAFVLGDGTTDASLDDRIRSSERVLGDGPFKKTVREGFRRCSEPAAGV